MPTSSIFRETVRICPSQVACDGVTLARGREICGRCEDRIKKRCKAAPTKLKGEPTEYELRKGK